MTTPTTLADAIANSGGGATIVKWDNVGRGVVVEGRVLATAFRQAHEVKSLGGGRFERGEPATWKDGSPMMEAAITVQTDIRDDPDDDGARTIIINWWTGQKRAFLDACTAAGVKDVKPGDTFAAVWTSGEGERGDPRVFAYKITPGSGLGAAIAGDDPFAKPAAPAPSTPSQFGVNVGTTNTPPPSTPTPTPAPEAPAAGVASKPEQVKALHAAGLPVDQIAALTGYTPAAVQALINLG